MRVLLGINPNCLKWVSDTSLIFLALLFVTGCSAHRSHLNDEARPATQADLRPARQSVVFTVPAQSSQQSISRYASSYNAADEATLHQTVIQAVLRRHGLTKVSQFSLQTLEAEAIVAEIAPGRRLDEVLKALDQDPRIHSVQSIQSFRLMTYNDPYFAMQEAVNSDHLDRIHKISTGKNVVVGIIDTGVDRFHPELRPNIIYSRNLVADDQNEFDRDEHGTAVAGVIASVANNDLGIVGVAPDVRLMVFKACRQTDTAERTSCDSLSIIRALNDALVQVPDVLNLSLAGPRDVLIEQLLQEADRRGIVLVGAVDESLPPGDSFPANMPEVIAVGTAHLDNRGRSDKLLAPGIDVLTTSPGASYGFQSGSSMATAYISGVVALMKEQQPTLNSREILEFLRQSSPSNNDSLPVVDMCQALNRATGSPAYSCEPAARVAAQRLKPMSRSSTES